MIKQEINLYKKIKQKPYITYKYSPTLTQTELDVILKQAETLGYKKDVVLQSNYIPNKQLIINYIEENSSKVYFIGNNPGIIFCTTNTVKDPFNKPFGYSIQELQQGYKIKNNPIDIEIEDSEYEYHMC